MSKKGRAGIVDGSVIATVSDKFGESRNVVQRGSRIRIANTSTTPIIVMNRVAAIALGEKCKALRLARGWSLEEAAIRSGMVSGWPKQRMWEIESGQRAQGVRIGTLYCLANTFGVEVADLLPSVAAVMEQAPVQETQTSFVSLSAGGRVVQHDQIATRVSA